MSLENLQSRIQWKKVSSCNPHREQVDEGVMFRRYNTVKVGTSLLQASQMRNVYFSRILSLQIQDQEILSLYLITISHYYT